VTKSGRQASLRLAGLGVMPSIDRLRMDALDALWRSVQKAVCPTDVVWAGRPKLSLGGLALEAFRPSVVLTAPQRLEITPGWVDILCSDHGTEFLRFTLGVQAFRFQLVHSGKLPIAFGLNSPSRWLW
jgi:hypothetical protein